MLKSRLARARSDRGAVAALVALVFASMALFAMAAFAVDTGQFYAEKAQLQNGADAGAQAVAESCAKGSCDTSQADTYANSNANDHKSAVEYTPCGNGGTLNPCPDPRGEPDLCPKSTPTGNWVDVPLETETSDGKHVLPSFFSKAVLGDKYVGKMHACARAAWGPPKIGTVLAVTFAECVWNDAIANFGYADSPPALPDPGIEQSLELTTPDSPTDPGCHSGPGIGPLPGGFGWTQSDPSKACTAQLLPSGNGWYESDPGNAPGDQCAATGHDPGVIPCAANPVVTGAPYPPSPLNDCPDPATPSPLLIPIFDRVCSMTGSSGPSADEVQTITITNATGGSFTLSFTDSTGATATTGNLAKDVSANDLQTALEGLSTIGAGNVTVASAASGVYTVTFVGAYHFKDVNTLTANSNLTPKTGRNKASLDITTTTQGNFASTACPSGGPFESGKKYYHLLTLAAFVVTGFGGSSFAHDQRSWLTDDRCPNGSTGCIMGYFVQAIDPGGDIDPGGSDAGVSAVKLVG